MRKKMINLSASLLGVATVASTLFSCNTQQQESPMKAKVEEYAQVELKSDLVNNLNDKEKELVKIFFQVGEINRRSFLADRLLVTRASSIPSPTIMQKSLP